MFLVNNFLLFSPNLNLIDANSADYSRAYEWLSSRVGYVLDTVDSIVRA